MKRKTSKIIVAIIMMILVIIIILVSVYLTKSNLYQKNNKNREDFVGTFSWGAPDKSMENMVYLAIMKENESKQGAQFIEYYVSTEEVIKQGECFLTDDNYAALLDENGKAFAYVVYTAEGYLLFEDEKKAETIVKIGDGPVLPTNSN